MKQTLYDKLWTSHVVGEGDDGSALLYIDRQTQTLRQRRARNLRVNLNGILAAGVAAKDVVLAVVGRLGSSGAVGHAIEFTGDAVRAFSMAARTTLCNMGIEAGAGSALVAPDETTFNWLERRPMAPKGSQWQAALDYWRTLASDPDAGYEHTDAIVLDSLAPQVTWGTNPEQVLPINDRVPDPVHAPDEAAARRLQKALDYMGLVPRTALQEICIDYFSSARAPTAASKTCVPPHRSCRAATGQSGSRPSSCLVRGHCSASRSRRPGSGFHVRRIRMARRGLLHVRGHERRPPTARPALRISSARHRGGQRRRGAPGGSTRHRTAVMRRFTTLRSVAVPLPDADIDTDIIFPARYLLLTQKLGLGPYAVRDRRFDAEGRERADFVLHRPPWRGAEVLVAGPSFGCGSSREQAPGALADLGLRCLIAPSFGEIFHANCINNGLLPVALPSAAHTLVMVSAQAGEEIEESLLDRTVTLSPALRIAFDIGDRQREALLRPWNEIDRIRNEETLHIQAFEARQRSLQPWLFSDDQRHLL